MTSVKKLLRDIGISALSSLAAFLIFMGIVIAQGAWSEPTAAPPGDNAPEPLNTSAADQEKMEIVGGVPKYGKLGLEDVLINSVGKWVSQINLEVVGKIPGRESYHVKASKETRNVTVRFDGSPIVDMTAVYRLCRDEDGCRVTLSARDYDPINKPGSVLSRGPITLFISQAIDPVTSLPIEWWRTSPPGPDPTLGGKFTNVVIWDVAAKNGAEGLDKNGIAQTILRAWDCHFTDGEFLPTVGRAVGDGFSFPSDSLRQYGLMNADSAQGLPSPGGGTYSAGETVCQLDIED